jgi:predicted transcriptional regulator
VPNLTKEEFEKLKQEVEQARTEAERAQGARDQLMARLKNEFDCDSLEDAKVKLADLKKKKEVAEKLFEKQLRQYKAKWKNESE